ncbi:MAG: FKBP-type peptidyl-prolyl cis-trans isomerase [Bacteroidetes bacterium]|nr:FKBP-type peptidyl-prolyl cis-trans isomerase [Bacteroidota bacterium]MBS1629157.1 FKBP-type peptidyl-prolyl cis-trans isomerase [Bacteroidota bacterium]
MQAGIDFVESSGISICNFGHSDQLKIMSLQEKLRQLFNQKSEDNEKFLSENSAREEVVTLPSGLQYEILQEGQGPRPEATSRVTVHYEGRLTNGTIFDSSYKRNQPASFGVRQVISGWTEGLQLMPLGSKWRLVIPPDLGYGARGAGSSIPPHAVLVFDVELLGIN